MRPRERRKHPPLPTVPALLGSAALATLVALGVTGCPPSLDDPEVFETACPGGFSVDGFFQSTCTRVGCHVSGMNAAAGLDLASAGAFGRMYGKLSSACSQPLISQNGPGQSLLIAKLEGTAPCGGRMPLGGTPLTSSQIACVETWITTGIASAGPLLPVDAGPDAPSTIDAGDGGGAVEAGPGDAAADGPSIEDAGEDGTLDGGDAG